MPDLATFQRDFAQALSRPGSEPGPFAIYRNTSLAGVTDALADNYPVVRALVGDAMFRNIAVDYALAQPPDSPILAIYGRRFADWVEAQGWSQQTPYLADVARIERLHLEALFAADAQPLQTDALAEIAPEAWEVTRLSLHPAVRYYWSPLPAMSIWLAHQAGTPTTVGSDWRAQGALFTRPYATVEARVLDAPAHLFVSAIHRGDSVGVAALLTAERYPDADVGGLFRTFLEAGLFAASRQTQRTPS